MLEDKLYKVHKRINREIDTREIREKLRALFSLSLCITFVCHDKEHIGVFIYIHCGRNKETKYSHLL